MLKITSRKYQVFWRPTIKPSTSARLIMRMFRCVLLRAGGIQTRVWRSQPALECSLCECFKSKVRIRVWIRCKTGSSDTAKAREASRKAACSFKPQRVPFLSRCRSHFINDTWTCGSRQKRCWDCIMEWNLNNERTRECDCCRCPPWFRGFLF